MVITSSAAGIVAATGGVSRSRSLGALGRRDRPVIVDVEILHCFDGFLLGHSCIALGLVLRLAFAIGIFGIVEDAEELFALSRQVRIHIYMRDFNTLKTVTHRADNLAGLVDHGHRLSEWSHGDRNSGSSVQLPYSI